MKTFTLSIFLMALMFGQSFAQTPKGIKYQTTVRNSSGEVMLNQPIVLQTSIIKGNPFGNLFFTENHPTTANHFGLAEIVIGEGTVVSGSYDSVDWKNDTLFLKIAIDLNNSGNFTEMGVTQFLSIPYAKYADMALGLPVMTTEQRNDLVSLKVGMKIYNLSTNCINYWNGTDWFATCANCTPQPTAANAGPDQNSLCALSTNLEANSPEEGTGVWAIVSGTGGIIQDINDPQSLFTGIVGEVYTLSWTITTVCGSSVDFVNIAIEHPASIANAGASQWNVAGTSLNLSANTPQYGVGNWQIVKGIGGTVANPANPTSLFTGLPGYRYVLEWNIGQACNSSSDTVWIQFAFNCGTSITDARDGQTYSTVQIGNQCWMKKNLNIGTRINGSDTMTNNGIMEKYCYNNDPANCNVYGGLYQWDEMMQYQRFETNQGVCPEGWHIPLFSDLEELITFAGGSNVAGGALKETGTVHWKSPNNGATNSTGFTALPGGQKGTNFYYLTEYASFWSSEWFQNSSTLNKYISISHNSTYVGTNQVSVPFAISLRCIRGYPPNQVPFAPSDPVPFQGQQNVDTSMVLSWVCHDFDGDPLLFDVYFGDVINPPLVAMAISDTFYMPGVLNMNTPYYWKVVAHDNHGHSVEGPAWNFLTVTDEVWACGESFLYDSRDGRAYQTIQIGDQCWMTENLNIGEIITSNIDRPSLIEKLCYDNDPANCEIFGGMYSWPELMGISTLESAVSICPPESGWHLPSKNEFEKLKNYLGGETVAGGKMKTTGTLEQGNGLWLSPNTGATNESGFSALPGGTGMFGFNYKNTFGYFWTSSKPQLDFATIFWTMHNNSMLQNSNYETLTLASVRCVFGNQPPQAPSNPNPPDQTLNCPLNQKLSWYCIDMDNDPINYDLYLGNCYDNLSLVASNIQDTFYIPDNLNYGTNYCWYVVAHDDHGNSNTILYWWSFTTEYPPIVPCPGIPTVSYAGKVYNTVQIGNQCWLRENLDVGNMITSTTNQSNNGAIEKYCIDNNASNCDVFGGLYQWNEAMQYSTNEGIQGICPPGWSIPTNTEITDLTYYLEGQLNAGGKMKTTGTIQSGTGLWQDPNTGATNQSGFSGLPGLHRNTNGSFAFPGTFGYWWTSTMQNSSASYYYLLSSTSSGIGPGAANKLLGRSIRCIKD